MKKVVLILFLFLTSVINAQKKKNHNMPNSTNMLDMQVEVFKDITKDSVVDGIDFSKINNYKDLVNQAKDLSPREKAHYKAIYEMQKKEPNQKTKDSLTLELKKVLSKKKND